MTCLPAALLAGALVLPDSGLADDWAYDPAILDDCLSREAVAEARIGLAAQACLTAEDAADYGPAVAICSSRETAQWDRMIAAADDALATEAANLDDMLPDAGNAERLAAMRSEWAQFRTAARSHEEGRWAGGSGEAPEAARRDLHLTAVYAIWLMRGAGQLEAVQ